MKKLLSLMLCLLMLTTSVSALDPDSTYVEPFTDYSWGDTYYDSVEWMYEYQVIEGYEDGTFRPDNCVNRAEFLKMAYIMDEASLSTGLVEFFPDVDSNDWFYTYVTNAVNDGIVQGYDDGLFKPDNCVNRVEAMKVAVLLMTPDEVINNSAPLYYDDKIIADMKSAVWYSKYARFLFTNRLVGSSHTTAVDNPSTSVKQINFYPEEGMTRAEVAEMLYNLKAFVDGKSSPDPLPVVCTLEAVAGLEINVKDQDNNPISDVTIFVDGEEAEFYNTGYGSATYSGLYEQAGDYNVVVSKDGYDSVEIDVTIEEDNCHVITKTYNLIMRSN